MIVGQPRAGKNRTKEQNLTFQEIETALLRYRPQLADQPASIRAAVALVLRAERGEVEMLFVERATHRDDPWSGNLAFPGGKVEATDETAQMAAERETREELGLDLSNARLLGRLSDIVGETRPVQVSCFVYRVVQPPSFILSEEISDAFWVPLSTLNEPTRHVITEVRFTGKTYNRPAIRLPLPGKPVLWGLTYRLVLQFLQLVQGQPRR